MSTMRLDEAGEWEEGLCRWFKERSLAHVLTSDELFPEVFSVFSTSVINVHGKLFHCILQLD